MPADINIIDVKCTDIDRKSDRRRDGSALFGSAELEKIAEDFRLYEKTKEPIYCLKNMARRDKNTTRREHSYKHDVGNILK